MHFAADNPIQKDSDTVATLRQALAYAQSIVDTVREPMLILDGSLHVRTASRAFCGVFEVSREDTEGSFIYDLGNGQWNIPALRTLLEGEICPDSVGPTGVVERAVKSPMWR